MSHEVFLSYSSNDKAVADEACAVLERGGVRVWMAPRDILPGIGWGASIVDAIRDARVMVLIFSAHANTSAQIEREVERAVNQGVPVIPFRIEDIKPVGAMEYFINTSHWLDAFSAPMTPHLDRLVEVVRLVIDKKYGHAAASVAEQKPPTAQQPRRETAEAPPVDVPRKAPDPPREERPPVFRNPAKEVIDAPSVVHAPPPHEGASGIFRLSPPQRWVAGLAVLLLVSFVLFYAGRPVEQSVIPPASETSTDTVQPPAAIATQPAADAGKPPASASGSEGGRSSSSPTEGERRSAAVGDARSTGAGWSAQLSALPVKLSATDVQRFSEFDTTRRAALSEAFTGGDAGDVADLRKTLAGDPQPIGDGDLTGEWRCRTLKLGGILPLTPYGFFRCRIFMAQGELVFQKTSGSQRTRGGLYRLTADRFAYVGASTVNDDPIRRYGADPIEDQVGILVKTSDRRLRIEFPAPHYESHLDIMDLVR
jgi:hypothetical protein